MITAIIEKTEVQPGGLIKLHAKGVPVYSKVTVSAVIDSGSKKINNSKKTRILGAHRGRIKMSDDFDLPLPDSFWIGK